MATRYKYTYITITPFSIKQSHRDLLKPNIFDQITSVCSGLEPYKSFEDEKAYYERIADIIQSYTDVYIKSNIVPTTQQVFNYLKTAFLKASNIGVQAIPDTYIGEYEDQGTLQTMLSEFVSYEVDYIEGSGLLTIQHPKIQYTPERKLENMNVPDKTINILGYERNIKFLHNMYISKPTITRYGRRESGASLFTKLNPEVNLYQICMANQNSMFKEINVKPITNFITMSNVNERNEAKRLKLSQKPIDNEQPSSSKQLIHGETKNPQNSLPNDVVAPHSYDYVRLQNNENNIPRKRAHNGNYIEAENLPFIKPIPNSVQVASSMNVDTFQPQNGYENQSSKRNSVTQGNNDDEYIVPKLEEDMDELLENGIDDMLRDTMSFDLICKWLKT